MEIPTFDQMFNPVLQALKQLGGSGSISELEEKVGAELGLTEEQLTTIHRGNRSKFSYNLAWTRTYLKLAGYIQNSTRGVWSLTPEGRAVGEVNASEVVRQAKSVNRLETLEADVIEGEDPETASQLWQEALLSEMQKMTPDAFERLCQRLLREAGFAQVEVTGRTGDGGIDGKGIFKIGGLLSFPMIFQCKRYVGSVSSQQIRDFRGAMAGRVDKGLFITTGNFTRDARQEAVREGAPPVDLINGEQLVEKLKEFNLGVKVSLQESVEIDSAWFKDF